MKYNNDIQFNSKQNKIRIYICFFFFLLLLLSPLSKQVGQVKRDVIVCYIVALLKGIYLYESFFFLLKKSDIFHLNSDINMRFGFDTLNSAQQFFICSILMLSKSRLNLGNLCICFLVYNTQTSIGCTRVL